MSGCQATSRCEEKGWKIHANENCYFGFLFHFAQRSGQSGVERVRIPRYV